MIPKPSAVQNVVKPAFYPFSLEKNTSSLHACVRIFGESTGFTGEWPWPAGFFPERLFTPSLNRH